MSYIWEESLLWGQPFTDENPIATSKPDYRYVAWRGMIAKLWLYEQKRDSKVCIVDEVVQILK